MSEPPQHDPPGEEVDGTEARLDGYLAHLAEGRTRLADGRRVTSEELAPIVYEDLRRIAAGLFRHESEGLTLQPTALVNEAYLRLADQREGWANRAQFLSVAALAMRRILVGSARERARLKRGGALKRVTLTGRDPVQPESGWDPLDLEGALQALGEVKERYVRIAELRYFAGLSIPEIASVLGVGTTVIEREWAKARAYLSVRLEGYGEGAG